MWASKVLAWIAVSGGCASVGSARLISDRRQLACAPEVLCASFDPSVPDYLREQVENAMNSWTEETGGGVLWTCSRTARWVTFQATDDSEKLGSMCSTFELLAGCTVNRSQVWFDSELARHWRRGRATAAHEIGHVLGLEHSDDPNDVMFRSIRDGQVDVPTANDVARWAARSCGISP